MSEADKPPERLPEQRLFEAAQKRAPRERAAFLQRVCGGDDGLRGRVEALLRASEDASADASAAARDAAMPGLSAAPSIADASAAATAERLEGQTIGPYRVLEEIGSGGMAVVYLAEQNQPVKRRVALKVIKLGMDTREVMARFESERQALALMSHPNIAQIFDAGSTERGRPFFVMEHVRGAPIRAYCDDHGLDTRARVRLFVDVCHGVQHAHMKGVIHRDLKPSNILVAEEEGRPVAKIIDFGVAKATNQRLSEQTLYTEVGRIIGTPEYMSPEQAGFDSTVGIDTRSDVYSLGVVLFELLAGTLPFDAGAHGRRGFEALQRAIREEDPPALATAMRRAASTQAGSQIARDRATTIDALARTLRDDLSWIALRALEKNPSRRYQSAREFADDLQRYLEGAPVEAGPPSGMYRVRKTLARYKIAFAFAATVIVFLVAFTVSTLLQSREIQREADRANANAKTASEAAERAEKAAAAERVAREAAADQAEAARRESQTAARISEFLLGLFRASRPGESAKTGDLTARDLLDRGAARIRSELRDDPAVQSALLREIGAAYDQLGVYEEANKLLEEALIVRERIDPDDPKIGDILWELGQNYRKRGEYEAAERAFQRLVALCERQGDKDDLAVALDGLGGLFSDSRRAEQSIPLFERAIALRIDAKGADEPTLEVFYNNLGVACYRTGDLEAAEAAFLKVQEIYERIEKDPTHAYLYANLGALQARLERREAAEKTLRRALTIVEQSFDADHQLIGGIHIGLARLYADWPDKDPALAEASYEVVIANRRKNLPGHPVLGQVLEEFGQFLSGQGRFDRALGLLREARPIYVGQWTADSLQVAALDASVIQAEVGLKKLAPDLVARAEAAVAVLERVEGGAGPLPMALRALAAAQAATGDAAGAAATNARLEKLSNDNR